MARTAKLLFKICITFLLTLLAINLLNLLPVTAEDNTITADTDGIDEIVVVGTDGFVYVYDYTGKQVFKSLENGWTLVTTADLNNDDDHEIIVANNNTLKVYDPQISGTEFTFSATYNQNAGQFHQLITGNFISNDNAPEIALLRSLNSGGGRIVIYDPPNTTPVKDEPFLTDWDDFAVGDYDGDDDDDFALIFWDQDGDLDPDKRNWVELRKGHDPGDKLEDSDSAGQYSDSRWYDIASGDFVPDNGSKVEWVGTQKEGDKVIVQRWSNKSVKKYKSRTDDHFDFLATGNIRNDGEDREQIVLLRNATGNDINMRFVVTHNPSDPDDTGLPSWASLQGLGTGWLNLAIGRLDTEKTYLEVIILKQDLIRIFLVAQSTSAAMDCRDSNECLDIVGSFKGPLALGDLGVNITQVQPEPYAVSPTTISRAVPQTATVSAAQFNIYGDQAIGTPLKWVATALPDPDGSAIFRSALRENNVLDYTITSAGLRYQTPEGVVDLPAVPWLALSSYQGTTPSTVTVTFSNTHAGSPLHTEASYKATIIILQNDLPDDRVRLVDVSVIVGIETTYLPLVLK